MESGRELRATRAIGEAHRATRGPAWWAGPSLVECVYLLLWMSIAADVHGQRLVPVRLSGESVERAQLRLEGRALCQRRQRVAAVRDVARGEGVGALVA